MFVDFSLVAASSTSSQFYANSVLLLFIALVVVVRLLRSANVRKFSRKRIFILPAIFLLFTLTGLIDVTVDYWLYLAILICGGVLPGMRWGEGTVFFEADGVLMYRRSRIILGIWAVSLISRVAIELVFPSNLVALLVVEGILSFETGMIAGESYRLWEKYKQRGIVVDAHSQ